MSTPHVRRDPRLKGIEWRDLTELRPLQKVWEITLSLPWLLASLVLYHHGWVLPGAVASFFFFLTGLRQAHGAQHYTLGVPRAAQDAILAGLSVLMLASMHAIQVTHLHHHRHCLDDEDVEASPAGLPAWGAILAGPGFILRLHRAAWRLAKPSKKGWIVAELAIVGAVVTGAIVLELPAARWHVAAMAVGECLTGFFAVWTVHHGCDRHHHIARTQRGWMKNIVSYEMFYHIEHHLFPAVPTVRLPELARRIDAVAPELRTKQVF